MNKYCFAVLFLFYLLMAILYFLLAIASGHMIPRVFAAVVGVIFAVIAVLVGSFPQPKSSDMPDPNSGLSIHLHDQKRAKEIVEAEREMALYESYMEALVQHVANAINQARTKGWNEALEKAALLSESSDVAKAIRMLKREA